MSDSPCLQCWGEGTLLEEMRDGRYVVLECDSCHGTGDTD